MPTFDSGPPGPWAQLFDQAPLAAYVGHPSDRFRTEFAPVYYRGRLDGSARVLVVGQDPSTDEILAQRILVGEAGQRVQRLLTKLGVARSYVMFNTFLFGVHGQFDSTLRTISSTNPICSYRNSLLDRVVASNQIQAVLAIGKAAQHAVAQWPGAAGLTRFDLMHPTALGGVTADWNAALPALQAAIPADPGVAPDPTPFGATFTPADLQPIPREDLPFGLPSWHGTGGTHSSRDRSRTRIVWSV